MALVTFSPVKGILGKLKRVRPRQHLSWKRPRETELFLRTDVDDAFQVGGQSRRRKTYGRRLGSCFGRKVVKGMFRPQTTLCAKDFIQRYIGKIRRD